MEKHPHGRGEDNFFRVICDVELETPPRAWGRLLTGDIVPVSKGNTPTGVGKTCRVFRWNVSGEKHPHGRGED